MLKTARCAYQTAELKYHGEISSRLVDAGVAKTLADVTKMVQGESEAGTSTQKEVAVDDNGHADNFQTPVVGLDVLTCEMQ